MNGKNDNGKLNAQKTGSLTGDVANIIDSLDNNSVLDQTPISQTGKTYDSNPTPKGISKRRAIGLTMLCVGLLGGVFLVFKSSAITDQQAALNNTQPVKPQSFLLPDLSSELSAKSPQTADKLNINGQLNANASLVVTPTTKPLKPATGQIYFDSKAKQLEIYNGKKFIMLQGGGNTFVTNNNVTNVAGAVTNVTRVTKVTNVTNLTNGGGGVDGAAGTSGHIAMFTATNTLGNSLITQSGSSLSTGNGVESVTLGSTAGVSAAALQGGTAGVSIVTGNQTGSSGDITIQSGDSSTLASGDINIDTGIAIITGTLVGTKTFETSLDNMVDGFGYHDTLAQSTAEADGGTHSLSVTVGLGPLNAPQWKVIDNEPYFNLPVVAGHKYAFSAWIRAGGADSSTVTASAIFSTNGFTGGSTVAQDAWGTVTDKSSGWTQVTGVLTAPASSNFVLLEFDSNIGGSVGDIHYLDDISVTDLSSSTSVADLNLGTTNAQRVTLGNVNEIGATSIYGGGINMDAGLGDFNIHGGDLSEEASLVNIGASTGSINMFGNNGISLTTGNPGGTGTDIDLTAADANGCTCGGGNINLQAGSGSGGGTAGSIGMDTGRGGVSGTVVDDLTFETGTDNMLGTNATLSQSNASANSGTFSLAETSNGGSWSINEDQTSAGIPVTPGHKYYFEALVHAQATPEALNSYITWLGHGTLTLNGASSSNVGYALISGTGTAPAGTTQAFWNFTGNGPNGQTNFFDDLVVTDLSTSAGTAAINVGTQWTQAVNIGNVNQVDATTIQGGAGININSGAGSTSISGGNVVISPTADSTTAFQVNSTSDTNLINVDTTNNTVKLGTGAGATLGDTVIEPDAGEDSGIGNMMASQFTTTGGGTVISMTAYTGQDGIQPTPNNNFQFAIYSDNSGAPGTYIASSSIGTMSTTGSWTSLPISAVLSAATTYWLVYWQNDNVNNSNNGLNFGARPSALTVTNTFPWQSGPNNGFPANFPTSGEVVQATLIPSIYATYSASGSAVVVNGSGTLTQNGAAIFEDPSDSPDAFQIQNSLGTSLFTADTANMAINVAGSALFKDATDSATAFQVQDASSSPVFTVDTSAKIVTVNTLVDSTDLTLGGHFITNGTAINTFVSGAAADCSGSGTVGVSGNDTSGTVTITTGTGPCATGGVLATITFVNGFASTPLVMLSSAETHAATLQYFNGAVGTNSFTIDTNNAPAPTTTYKYNYWVVQ